MSDVCLVLEGTFPYITGGVSSCVYQLIEETPQLTYNIIYIGAKKSIDKEYKYPIPKNVNLIKEIFLFDNDPGREVIPHKIGLKPDQIDLLKNSLLFQGNQRTEELYQLFFDPNTREYDPDDLFCSKEIWDLLESEYNEKFDTLNAPSFIDYFYTWRFSNYPLFKILSSDIPKSNVYHSMCTGYAGLLASIAKLKYNSPMILTEHGIYTHERKIEISQSDWLYSSDKEVTARRKMSFFKDWWMNKFINLGDMAYTQADDITTLYEGNKQKQINHGANEEKITIIPNGINKNKLTKDIASEHIYKKQAKISIALIGRVVPIKDIKTFIKSISYLNHYFSDYEVVILGPTDEDTAYFEECETLVKILGLNDKINFCGKVDLKYYYPQIDLVVLSSISEGQPLVMLEAFSFNIPVITTDVGSCSELIFGQTPEDQSLGQAGFTVPFGMSQKLGEYIYRLCENDGLREEMGKIAFERYQNFYQEKFTIKNYLNIYHKHLNYLT